MIHYDYIIAGAGAAGLMLAWRMANTPEFRNNSILLIDKDSKITNDRTWCFWEKGTGEWEQLVHRQWKSALFKGPDFERDFPLDPYSYKMIRGIDFYQFMKKELLEKPCLDWVQEEVLEIKEQGTFASLRTANTLYHAKKIFTSIFDPALLSQQTIYPYLKQHFIGWTVRTPEPLFQADTATFMDFSIPQQGNTRFMYVLPFSEQEALVEYTLFSEQLLSEQVYEVAINSYLQALGRNSYEILEKEKGNIPMCAYDFSQHNSRNVLHIGTAGGWTKASSGFTFFNCIRYTQILLPLIHQQYDFSEFSFRNRYSYYDLLLLDVLAEDNSRGAELFSLLFQKNEPAIIFAFLEEQSTIRQDLSILFSLPYHPFIKALWQRLFK